MIKIRPDRDAYETQLAKAAMVISGFLNRFPEPECQEQAEVVEMAILWIEETNNIMDDTDENIGKN